MTLQLPKIAQLLAAPDAEREAFIAGLSDDEAYALLHDWSLWARPKQLAPPGTWRCWLNLAGRGYGKTRVGAEATNDAAKRSVTGRLFLLGATYADVRDTMIEGESGILECAARDFRPVFQPSRWRLVYPNGAIAKVFSAEKPNRLRGPQHEFGWIDELAAFQYPTEVYDMAMFGLRLGTNPRVIITTTPKPIELLVRLTTNALICTELRAAADDSELLKRAISCVISVGSSYENRANLAESWFTDIISQYEGTRLGDQELLGVLLRDVPGALWTQKIIEDNRIKLVDAASNTIVDVHDALRDKVLLPEMQRVVVAVDPPARSTSTASEAGIVVAGKGTNKHGYMLADLSGRMSPNAWAQRAVQAYHDFKADRIIAEINNGGEMVEQTIRSIDPNVPVRTVTATRGKIVRAEPIAALDEQGKIHHVGTFGACEAQMTTWVPESGLPSPDRMDARVWAFTDLMLKSGSIVVA